MGIKSIYQSFLQSWLAWNELTPIWVFFAIAIPSIFVTTLIVVFQKWMEQGEDTWFKRLAIFFFGRSLAVPKSPSSLVGEKFDPAMLA